MLGHMGKPRLGIRKKFFTIRVIKHWHRLPSEVGAALGLSVFRRHLGTALSNVLLLSPGAVSQLGLTVSGLRRSLPAELFHSRA